MPHLSLAPSVVPVHSDVVVHSEHVILLQFTASEGGGGEGARYEGLREWDSRYSGTGLGAEVW